MKPFPAPLLAILVTGAFAVGCYRLVAASPQPLVPIQFGLFSLIGIAWVAFFDFRSPANMRGCMTFLSFGFVPVLSLLVLGADRLAAQPQLDAVVGWAGALRLPALLFLVVGALALINIGPTKLRRKRHKRFSDFFQIAVIALLLGAFAGVVGLVWMGLAWGLHLLGL